MSLLLEHFNKAVENETAMVQTQPQDPETGRLDRLKEIFVSIPEGKELLDLAEQSGCAILFNDHLLNKVVGKISFEDRAVYLDPQDSDAKLLHTLAHELRHLWQACTVDFSRSGPLSIVSAFVFTRVTEGDACAFATYFSEKLKEKTGIDIQHYNFVNNKVYTKTDMRETFLNFQEAGFAKAYDQCIIDSLESIQSEIDSGKMPKHILTKLFNCAAKPYAVDPGFMEITINGTSADGVKYLDFKSVEELTAAVIAHVPQDTLQQAQKLLAEIKRSAAAGAGLKL